MSKTSRWIVKHQQDIKLRYDFKGEHQLRELLVQEMVDMADEHDRFCDLSGSMHNSELIPSEWEGS